MSDSDLSLLMVFILINGLLTLGSFWYVTNALHNLSVGTKAGSRAPHPDGFSVWVGLDRSGPPTRYVRTPEEVVSVVQSAADLGLPVTVMGGRR